MQYDTSDYGSMFVPQGWQCPICKRVYAPNWPWCTVCSYGVTNVTDTGTKIDYIYRAMVGDTPETMKQQTTDGRVK